MKNGFYAKKVGMTSTFLEGKMVPLTLLELYPTYILEKTTSGTEALICFEEVKKEKLSKPVRSIYEKNNVSFCKNIRKKSIESFSISDNKINFDFLNEAKLITVRGKTIGKGTQGAMKRHNFGGLRASHGVSISHRSHGSTGACQDPGKVFKGKKMAGRMGNQNITLKNLQVYKYVAEKNILALIGSVPGKNGNLIELARQS